MSDSKNITAWLLLGLLTVAGAGFAVLGVVQSHVPVGQAVTYTLAASNYTEDFSQSTPQGTETEHVVFQAPDSLGGFEQIGTQRTYVLIQGNRAFAVTTNGSRASAAHLVFRKANVQPAKLIDPAHRYLPYANQAMHVISNGDTHTFTVTQMGQVGAFVYLVSGWHVAQMRLAVPAARASVRLNISKVGTSPPVGLPAGATIGTGTFGTSSGG
jgi:hypothetical protein